jgi:hypothetical protein
MNSLTMFARLDDSIQPYLIYGGKEFQKRTQVTISGIWDLDKIQ